MIVIFIITSVFISAIWIDYYRLIGNYSKSSLLPILTAYILGCLSVLITLGIDKILPIGIITNTPNKLLSIFLYFTIDAGLVEEFSKSIPFLLIYLMFKKRLETPIDYIAYFSFLALGFLTVENVMYFSDGTAIGMRAILCTLGHIIDTSFIAYGIVLCTFKKVKSKTLTVVVFSIIGVLSHSLYDFFISFVNVYTYGWIPGILCFFITVPLFTRIINNSLNNSILKLDFKNTNRDKIFTRLLLLYCIVLVMEFITFIIRWNFDSAIYWTIFSIFTDGIVMFITFYYLSKIRIKIDKWEKLRLSLPLTYN